MNDKTNPPSQQDLDNAMELIIRAGLAGMSLTPKATPRADRKMEAWRKQQAKNKALAAECEQVSESLHDQIYQVVPKEYHKLVMHYAIMKIAAYRIDEHSYRLFSDLLKESKKILVTNKPMRKGKKL